MPISKKSHNPLIGLRLKPEDHARLERIAEREQRPLSSMSRLFLLKCMAEYEESLQPAPAASTTIAA